MPNARHRVSKDLLSLAREIAVFRDMAIAGEGNVSGALSDRRFLVKASGTGLSTLEDNHLIEVESAPILSALDSKVSMTDGEVDDLLLGARVDPEALKPSVESLFHAWLLRLDPVQVVGHVHPIAATALLSSPLAEEYAVRRLFPDQIVYCGPESVLVPYVDPGLALAVEVGRAVEAYRKRSGILPKTILIQNHGVIAIGRTARDVAAALMMAEKSARVFIDAATLGGPVFLSDEQVARIDGRIDEHYRQRVWQGPK